MAVRDLAAWEKFSPVREAICGSAWALPVGLKLEVAPVAWERKEPVLPAPLPGVAGRVAPAGRAAWLADDGLKLLDPLPAFGLGRLAVELPLPLAAPFPLVEGA